MKDHIAKNVKTVMNLFNFKLKQLLDFSPMVNGFREKHTI
jgi:hypothetical protein